MSKIVLSILFFLMTLLKANAQVGNQFNKLDDPETGAIIFQGQLSFNNLKELKHFKLEENTKSYKPDHDVINQLKPLLGSYKLVIFIGTWCEDSEYLIPQLFKVLKETNFPENKVLMYGVDREKKSNNKEELQYMVNFVPTIIVFQNNKEIGRITETVEKSVESDLLEIIAPEQEIE